MDDDNKEDVTHHELTVWSNQPQGRSDYQSISSCTSQQSYTSQSYVQAFAPAHFTHDGQYDSVGTTYRIGNETYQLTTPVQEVYHHQGSHSSFDRVSPVSGYHEASNAQALQQLQNLQTDGAASQMITIQGYPMQVLLEQQENRVTSSAINNASHNDVSETHNAHQLLQFAHQGHIYSCSSMTANTQQQNTLPSLMDSRGLRVQIPLNSYTNTQVDVTSGSDVLTGQRTSDDDDDDETDQAVSSISLEFHQPNNNTKVHALGDSFTTDVAASTGEHLPDLGQSSPEGSESFNCRNDNNLDGSLHHSSVNASSAMTCHILPTTSNIGHHNPINIDSTMSTVSMQPGAPDLYDNSLVLVAQSDQVSQNTMDQALDIASIENKEVRKSARLSCMEDNYLKSLTKPLYDPNLHVYTHNDIWCEECMKCYTSECPYHKLTLILDKVVLSRAWASLPSILQIFRLGDTAELGVFSKKVIPKQTQFGPFVASVVRDEDQLSKNNFILKIEDYQGTGDDVILETSDENKCNWMMFVRPAQSYAEQNLVVYQYGSDLYFTVCKQIEQKTELKVWYAAHYAYRNGATIHNLTKQEQEAIDEAENKWPCFECNKRFKTSALLQHHLLEHDDDTNDVSAALALNSSSEVKTDLNSDDNRRMNNSMFQNWKKKKTYIYLNKHLKKVKFGTYNDTTRRPARSLFKKKESKQDGGGQEWVCTNCELTFDNPSLLNLHTLTHAAENVGLDEIKFLAGEIGNISPDLDNITQDLANVVSLASSSSLSADGHNVVSMATHTFECPVCKMLFTSKLELIEHASTHAKTKKPPVARPYKCSSCWKAFRCEESLHKHLLCHGSEETKPLQCVVCLKRFMNNSALSCHMKTHSSQKYYMCPVCREEFDVVSKLREHTVKHEVNGQYPCPNCPKVFAEFNQIRKHMRAFHSLKSYPCPECNKIFPRPDKLKLHLLRHSNHREFMCEQCGRQFKRKDKLKEHIRRMHSAEREARIIQRKSLNGSSPKRFTPKVSPSDYHRFIYKCHTCLLGFKRRGMLVNHLAKRHPEVKPESVPELNLPILRTQRDYFCQYCDKIYKSSSKRKSHILKNHPGAELPMSGRKKDSEFNYEIAGDDGTYSQPVGSVTTVPHPCDMCHKQYASKAKLLQHQRKKHPGMVDPPKSRRVMDGCSGLNIQASAATQLQLTHDDLSVQQVQVHELQAADLLTQAMTELTQNLVEYRQQTNTTADVSSVGGGGLQLTRQATLVQPGGQTTTIELSQLGAAFAHFQPQAAAAGGAPVGNGQTIQLTAAQQASLQQQQQQQGQQQQGLPVSIQTFLPQKWTTFSNYTSRI